MKTFLKWVEDENLDLPVVTDSGEESGDNKAKLQERAKRSGIGYQYPDAYVRAQYPHKYFNPIAPDADYKLSAKPRSGGATD